ncbi:RNA polymerase sigma factor [Breznakia sp. OttesenSCG-928-G09]|nr:RNA polymerase sigma factor [Breznakia sp. OttesenSCG-928-G09]
MKRRQIDTKYIKQLKEGDESAFNKVFDFYKDSIYFFALSYVKNRADAEEVVQEVFIQVLKSIHTLKKLDSFGSWLHKIAYYMAISIQRSKGNQHIQLNEEYDIENMVVEKEGPDKMLSKNEMVERVREEIEKMPPKLTRIAQLRYFEDYSTREIAEIVDIPEGTVKSRLNKIRRMMKPILETNGISPSKYFSFALTPLIVEAMQLIMNKNSMPQDVGVGIKSHVLANAGSIWQELASNESVRQGLSNMTKAGLALATGGAGLIGLNVLNEQQGMHIEKVNIPTEISKYPIDVEIQVDKNINDEHVEVAHENENIHFDVENDRLIFEAKEDGDYTIQVDNDKMIIHVENDGRKPPIFVEVEQTEGGIQLNVVKGERILNYDDSYIIYQGKQYSFDEHGFIEGEFEGDIQIYIVEEDGPTTQIHQQI